MKHIITTLLILSFVTSLIGCQNSSEPSKQMPSTEPNISTNVSEPNESSSTESSTIPPADTFEIVGTVTYKNIEGGFYAIDTKDGGKYDPINLPASFRKDGLKVKVTARLKKDVMSLHMYGSIIDIVNISGQ